MVFRKVMPDHLKPHILAFLETKQIAFCLSAHAVAFCMAYMEM